MNNFCEFEGLEHRNWSCSSEAEALHGMGSLGLLLSALKIETHCSFVLFFVCLFIFLGFSRQGFSVYLVLAIQELAL